VKTWVKACFFQTLLVPLRVALSDECKDLIRSIFVIDTSKRATIASIKGHPW
jgi:hypothetical protein